MRNWSKVALGICLAAAAGSFSGVGRADERTEARAHFKKGMEAIGNGRYEDGIDELKKAYEILPHANVLFNIARAYGDSGDLEKAVVYYRKYLEGTPKDRDEVSQIVATLEARIRRQQAKLAEAQRAETPTIPPGTGPATGPAVPEPPKVARPPIPEPVAPVQPGSEVKTEDVFAESVVTASKEAQNPLDAPNSTSIVTEQDIRLSGIIKVPELLRRLAGVDIMQMTGSDSEVSLRGFNQRFSNKVLILVDGRSFFIDLLATTFWQALPIGVEDIERIEVVRGPGSALYGANAFNGVINIITKKPGEGKSGVSLGYGSQDQTHASLWATGRAAEFGWRVSAGYDYVPRWSREVPAGRRDLTLATDDQNSSQRTVRLDIRTQQQLTRDVLVGIGGGFNQLNAEAYGIGPINDMLVQGTSVSDVTAFLSSKHLQARAYLTNIHGNTANNAASTGQSLFRSQADGNVVDVDVRGIGSFETGKGIEHRLQVGLDYRFKAVQWTFLDRNRTENHAAFYVHDDVRLGQKFALVGDWRVDYVPYLQRLVQSPRIAALYHPSKQSTVRASLATAFRTPSFLEVYLDAPVQLPQTGAMFHSTNSDRPGFLLEPERVLSAEVGYLNSESEYFTLDTALFFTRTNNVIELASARPSRLGDVNNPTSGAGLDYASGFFTAAYGSFNNQCQAYNLYGGELGVRAYPREGIDIWANYTLNLVQQDNSDCPAAQAASLVNDKRTSVHKFNLGVQARTKVGLDGELTFHYVSPQTWAEQESDLERQQIVYKSWHLDAYTLLNGRIGYRIPKVNADVSVVGYNLLGQEHRQHPFGQLVGRRVMGFLTYRF